MRELLSSHPLKLLSVLVCLILVIGVLNRRRKRIHIPLMLSAMAIDVGMVLYLEIRRGVVESIPQRPMTPLLVIHITISVLVLILYGVQVVTGYRNAKGRRSTWHPRIAALLLPLRFANLITSFMIT
ncbi:MAG: DUF420 domain-containing protein [Planctomycetota bacterium]